MIKHIGLILDGNRRWSKKHALKPWEGHEAGRLTLSILTRYWASKTDIKYLSLYALSLKNFLGRSSLEKKLLYGSLERGFIDLLNDKLLKKEKIRVKIIGKWNLLPDKRLKKVLNEIISKTKKHNKKVLSFFICYDGQDEITEAAKEMKNVQRITRSTIKNNLFTKDLPPVDLLIRTGGEHRLSGFMLWDVSYAELYFTDILFPDFTPSSFNNAITEYKNRKRRFGK